MPASPQFCLLLALQLNENKALTKKKQWAPYNAKCTTCKSSIGEHEQRPVGQCLLAHSCHRRPDWLPAPSER